MVAHAKSFFICLLLVLSFIRAVRPTITPTLAVDTETTGAATAAPAPAAAAATEEEDGRTSAIRTRCTVPITAPTITSVPSSRTTLLHSAAKQQRQQRQQQQQQQLPYGIQAAPDHQPSWWDAAVLNFVHWAEPWMPKPLWIMLHSSQSPPQQHTMHGDSRQPKHRSSSTATTTTTMPPIDATHRTMLRTQNNVEEIPSSPSCGAADGLHKWIWTLPCQNTQAEYVLKRLDATFMDPRHAWVSRQALFEREANNATCFPVRKNSSKYGACFRAVFDDFVNEEEAQTFLDVFDGSDDGGTEGSRRALYVSGAALLRTNTFQQWVLHMRRILMEEFGVPGNLMVHKALLRYAPADQGNETLRFSKLHTDLLYGPGLAHLYTCILYLSTDGGGHGGGGTDFVDEVDGIDMLPHSDGYYDVPAVAAFVNAHIVSGIEVKSQLGRLVIFTSGTENLHSKQPVVHGLRKSLVVIFSCDDVDVVAEHTEHNLYLKRLSAIKQRDIDELRNTLREG